MSTGATATPSLGVAVERFAAAGWHGEHDQVAVEAPVALEYNGVAYAVMLASPTDLEDFALGFSLSEGILSDRHELFDLEVVAGPDGVTVRMTIAGARAALLKERRRALAGRTGCGLCGVESLAQVVRAPRRVEAAEHGARIAPETLIGAFAALRERQVLMNMTGSVHGAAYLAADGRLLHVREDVGRHNALDKTLGAAARAAAPLAQGALLVTSRASFEMVQKSVALGATVLAAISGPTGLAIRLADEAGMTLVGFTRDTSLTCYSHGRRLARGARDLS